jgi:hypothetical protein
MARPRSAITVLCAIIVLFGVPAAAAAQVPQLAIEAHGDPAAELPDELVTGPVLQERWTSLQPGLGIDYRHAPSHGHEGVHRRPPRDAPAHRRLRSATRRRRPP